MNVAILPLRIRAKLQITDDCWIWTASKTPSGYGKILYLDKLQPAHRVIYELLVGPIPEGLQLDHLCRNRSCVNPAHVEPVTARENLRRGNGFSGRNARKTHCVRGHEFTDENTYWVPRVATPPERRCRECDRLKHRKAWKTLQHEGMLRLKP